MGYFLSGVLIFSLIMLLCAYFCRESVRDLFKAPFRRWKYALISLISFIAVLNILGFTYLFGAYLNSLGAFPFWAGTDKIEGADYLSAAATIIGACISLIPIFWLIGQNKQIQEQMELQKNSE